MKLLRSLPIILGSLHAVLAASIFGLAVSDPIRRGLLPLILYFVDYPCSIVMEWLRRSLQGNGIDHLLVDGIVYVIVGSAWFFLIGILVRALVGRFVSLVASVVRSKNSSLA